MVRQVYSGLKSSLAALRGVVEAVVDPVRDRKELLLLAVELYIGEGRGGGRGRGREGENNLWCIEHMIK